MKHDLKCWPEPFEKMWRGLKTFEYRRDDRGFQVGDVLNLREWDNEIGSYTGSFRLMAVTYILRGPDFGVPTGFVIMSIRPVREDDEY